MTGFKNDTGNSCHLAATERGKNAQPAVKLALIDFHATMDRISFAFQTIIINARPRPTQLLMEPSKRHGRSPRGSGIADAHFADKNKIGVFRNACCAGRHGGEGFFGVIAGACVKSAVG